MCNNLFYLMKESYKLYNWKKNFMKLNAKLKKDIIPLVE